MSFINEKRFQELVCEARDESDRSAALILSSNLDNCLRNLLDGHFIPISPDHDDYLFKGHGPLSTFSSRIYISFSLGLINDSEFHDLNLIRKIRNKFAHDEERISFESDPIRSWCYSLDFVDAFRTLQPQAIETPRLCFHMISACLSYTLTDRIGFSLTQRNETCGPNLLQILLEPKSENEPKAEQGADRKPDHVPS